MPTDHEDGAPEELAVDVTFEDDLREIESSAAAYLEHPDDSRRTELIASLEQLDKQIERSEAFDLNSRVAYAFGSAPRVAVVGETSDVPVAEDVLPAEFHAQVELVRAAKDEVRHSSPHALDALRAAGAALAAIRSPGTTD